MSRLRLGLVLALALAPALLVAQPVLAVSQKPHAPKTRAAAFAQAPLPPPSPALSPTPSNSPATAPAAVRAARPAPAPAVVLVPAPPIVEPVIERVVEIRPGDPAQVTFAAPPAVRDAGLTPLAAAGAGSVPGLLGLLAALLVLRARRREEASVAVDELTGVLRRGAGLAAAGREVGRARRHSDRLAAAFIDVDGLKLVNDTRGHAAGDQLLRAVAAALRSRLREEDLVLRYGGDEFVCLLPGSSAGTARTLLSGVRDGLAARAGVGFSFGVTDLAPGDSADSLLARADAELYAERERRRTGR